MTKIHRARGSRSTSAGFHAQGLIAVRALEAHINNMRKKLSNWRISHIKGNRAEQLGIVIATDAESAVKVAIKEFQVTDKHRQSQLAARPDA